MTWITRALLVCLLPGYLLGAVLAGLYLGAVSGWSVLKRDWKEAGK